MQELEDLQGLCVGGARAEEQQLVLDNRVEQRRRIRVGEVDQRRPRGRVGQVEGQKCAACRRAAKVRVLEEGIAVGASARRTRGPSLSACASMADPTCAHRTGTAPLSCSWYSITDRRVYVELEGMHVCRRYSTIALVWSLWTVVNRQRAPVGQGSDVA